MRWLIIFLIGFSAVGAFAENVVLKLRNGDRITGSLVSENTNQIVVSTPWAKTLTVPLNEILQREKTNAPTGSTNVLTQKVDAKNPLLPFIATTNTVAVSKPIKPSAKFLERQSWHGRLDLGMDLGFSEQNRELFYGKAKIAYIPIFAAGEAKPLFSRFRDTFDIQVTYGKNNGVLSANQAGGTSKTDWDVGKRFFLYNLFGLGYDEIRKIDFQYEEGPGVGYHVITKTNFVLNTEVGMNYQVQSLRGNTNTQRFFARLAEDITWTLSKKLTFDERLELFPSVTSLGDYRLRFESNLRFALWQDLSLTLSLIEIYDTQPAAGVSRSDLQIRSLLGVSF